MHTKEYHVKIGDFPAGLLAKTLYFQYRGLGSTPGQETQIPHLSSKKFKNKNKKKPKNGMAKKFKNKTKQTPHKLHGKSKKLSQPRGT